MSLLSVSDLKVEFDTYGGVVKAVRGVSFTLERGETLAIVGESGSGKSVTVQALMGLTPTPPGRITAGTVEFQGQPLLQAGSARLRPAVRGKQIGMIFQDPMTSLNPTMPIGKQITETLRYHDGVGRAEARSTAIALLERVKIPEAARRVDDYPFEFSGGMRQRVMIAMAIACKPSLLIADEPTTALDVTVQAQILDLLGDLQKETQMGLILITHDLGVVARMADRVAVMYGGQIVESGTAQDIFYRPAHPYTLGLAAARPPADEASVRRLAPIDGAPPDLFAPPPGCSYAARCPWAMRVCHSQPAPVVTVTGSHHSRCWLQDERAGGRRPGSLAFAPSAPGGVSP